MPAELIQKEADQGTGAGMLQERQKGVNKTGIPDQLKNGMEAVSGLSFDDVRVHYSSRKPEAFYANAYTQGSNVYIGPGKEGSLPHELGHVIQQKQGRVRPTVYWGRTAVNDDRGLEREADRLGAMALQQKTPLLSEKVAERSMDADSPIQMDASAAFGERIHLPPVQKPPPVQEPSQVYPLMVYETFGPNKQDDDRQRSRPNRRDRDGQHSPPDKLVSVYQQSCQYPGKTICVIGLNQRYRIAEYASAPFPATNDLTQELERVQQSGHEAYIVPFKWKSVGGKAIESVENKAAQGKKGKEAEQAAFTAADKLLGYTLPYYEVRGRLMEEAEQIVETMPEEDVLFRWIDRDATEDSSGQLNAETLSVMAQSGIPEYLSGVYKWETGNAPLWRTFLQRFNEAERVLREKWYSLNRNLPTGSQLFYLPEPVLIMNKEAHGIAKGRLARAAAKSWRQRNIEDKRQDKESREAFFGDSKEVRFEPALSVCKPNKTMTYSGRSYLQGLEDMIMERPHRDLIDFCKVLSGVRQSAFDNGQWAFLRSQSYNEWYNREWFNGLWTEYLSVCKAKGRESEEAKLIESQLRLNKERRDQAEQLYQV